MGLIYYHNLDPVIAQIGSASVRWYGMMYIISFIVGTLILLRTSRSTNSVIRPDDVPVVMLHVVLGVVVGARIGWILFYGDLAMLFSLSGLLNTNGMSFHGGFLALVLALWWFARRRRRDLISVTDNVVTWCPIGLFFGRLGNFINGELYGKPTDGSWGVVFPGDPEQVPRHPTQLYEAALEGMVILAILGLLRWKVNLKGLQSAVFLFLYGSFRFSVEFVRLPDAHLGYLLLDWVTMGQVLSIPLAIAGLLWMAQILWARQRALLGRP